MTEHDGALLTASARGLLTAGPTGATLLARAIGEGWAGNLSPAAVDALFAAQADLLTAGSPLLDLVTLDAVSRWSDRLDFDAADTAVLYPAGVVGPLTGPVCDGAGYVLAGLERARALLVPRPSEGGYTLAVHPTDHGLRVNPVAGADPTLGLSHVVVEGEPTSVLDPEVGRSAWAAGVAAARVALARELIGLSRSMLDLAATHVSGRRQFGRPIGAFQAVRHQLADAFVAVEPAELAVAQAGERLDAQGTVQAKALAGWAHAITAEVCLQVHGAIGYTAEHALHRYIRRGWSLDPILGSARELDRAVGLRMLGERTAPRLADLAPP